MASSNNLLLVLTFFFPLFAFCSLPTISAAKPKHPISPPSSELVGKLCNDHSIMNRRFCLKALSGPEAAAAKDAKQLTKVMMKLAAANARSTLAVIEDMLKNPPSTAAAKGLQICAGVYRYSIQSFGMIFYELIEDPLTANYDVSVIGPSADECEDALAAEKIHVRRISVGNEFLHYYSNMGAAITSEVTVSV